MFSRRIWLVVSLVGAFLFPAATAQECGSGGEFNVTSQYDLDLLSKHCTTLVGDVIIASNFSGPFALPGIKNITRKFQLDYWKRWSPTAPSPTSIDMPDLESLGSWMSFGEEVNFTSVKMPKLEVLGDLTLGSAVPEMDFGALREVRSITLSGTWENISFPSLEKVNQSIVLCNTESCDEGNTDPALATMDISLPVLKQVGGFSVIGDVSSISLPKLESTGFVEQDNHKGLRWTLVSGDNPLNISLPSLEHVRDVLYMRGDIGSLSMPSLKDTNAFVQIVAYRALPISLPLETAGTVQLQVNISSVDLPSLKNISSLYVSSTLDLDCDGLEKAVNRTLQNPSDSKVFCRSEKKEKSPGNDVGAKVGISIGVVMGFLILFAAGMYFVRKNAKKKLEAKRRAEAEVGVGVVGGGETVVTK